MNLSKLQETGKNREAWHAIVHGVTESDLTEWLNNNSILAKLFWFVIPHEITAKMLARTAVFLPTWLQIVHSHGWQDSVGHWEKASSPCGLDRCLSVLMMWSSPLYCWGILTVRQLASPTASDSRECEAGNSSVFYDLTSQGTFFHFHCILGWTDYWVILVSERHIDIHSWAYSL